MTPDESKPAAQPVKVPARSRNRLLRPGEHVTPDTFRDALQRAQSRRD